MAIEPGQTLLHYRLIEKIGEGGMGVVWKAEDTKLQRHVALKVLPEATADFTRAMELNPDSSTNRLFYALFQMSTLRYDTGVELLQSAIRQDPLNILLLAILAVGHEGTGDFVEARRVIDRVREIDPHNARGYYGVAFLERQAHGNLVRARTWLLQAMERDPEDYELSSRLVFLYLDLDHAAAAERYLDQALAVGAGGTRPSVAQVYYMYKTGSEKEAQRLALMRLVDWTFPHRGNSRAELLRLATVEMDAPSGAELHERVFPALKSRTPFTERSWDWPGRTALEFAQAEVDYARLQSEMGDQATAEFFLDDAEKFTRMVPRMGRLGFGTLDAEIAAVRGDPERAMDFLDEAVEAGWVANWWWTLRHNPNLSPLHERADYLRLVEQLESKLSRQRAELE